MTDNNLKLHTWSKLLSRGVAPAGSRAAGDFELVNNWLIDGMMSRVRRSVSGVRINAK